MALPLLLLDGVFVLREDPPDLVVTDVVRGDSRVDEFLEPFHRKIVEVSLHHHPKTLDKTLPGGGSCFWGGFCPHGHRENPAWLFHLRVSGLLTRKEGQWYVGATLLDFSKMPGHSGRLVLFDPSALEEKTSAVEGSSPEDLMKEASELIELLGDLRKTVGFDDE